MNTSESQNTEKTQVSRELETLERDWQGNVHSDTATLASCHEATRFTVFVEAIAHHYFVQNRIAYQVLHREFSKHITHLNDTSRSEGVTQEAEDKFGSYPEARSAINRWATYRKNQQKNLHK